MLKKTLNTDVKLNGTNDTSQNKEPANKLPDPEKKTFVRSNTFNNSQHSVQNTKTSKAAKFSSLFKNNHEIPRVGE
jgi:hypothetical protein